MDHNIPNQKGSWSACRVSPQYLQSLWVFSRFNTMNSDRKSASAYLNNYPIRSEPRVRVQVGWTFSLLCIRRCLEFDTGPPVCLAWSPLGRAFILGAECRLSAGVGSGSWNFSLNYQSILSFNMFHVFLTLSPPQMSMTPAFHCHLFVSSLMLPAVL